MYCVQGAGVSLHPLVPEPGPRLPAGVQRGAVQVPAPTHLHHLQSGQRLDQVSLFPLINVWFWVYYNTIQIISTEDMNIK